MNLPNKLTAIRLILAVPFIYFLQESAGTTHHTLYRMIAFGIFIFASLTDWLDGYIARKYNLITDLGKIMDPSSTFYIFFTRISWNYAPYSI